MFPRSATLESFFSMELLCYSCMFFVLHLARVVICCSIMSTLGAKEIGLRDDFH